MRFSPIEKDTRNMLPCIVLTGMAASGKSTVGQLLARELGWAFLDSDLLIEAIYARRLQEITDLLGKEAFIEAEATVIASIRAYRTVIATGGSVIYREKTMRHLRKLGVIVYLDAAFPVIQARVRRNPNRGLAIAPGQSLEDIFREREALYRSWAGLRCDTAGLNARQCALWIRDNLPWENISQNS